MTHDIDSIAARIMLSTLSMRAWRPNKFHSNETAAERSRHGTSAPRVYVTLTESTTLKAIGSAHTAAYAAHKALTLPSCQDGMRIVPASRQFEHAQRMQEAQTAIDGLVAAFVAFEYDVERQNAPARLGPALYDPKHWPAPQDIAARFSFEARYLPCPTDGAWAEWLQESGEAAHAELRERISKALQRVVDRCRSDGPLYETVFTDCAALAALLPDLDIARRIDPSVTDGLARLGGFNKDACVDDDSVRGSAANVAADLLAAFGK